MNSEAYWGCVVAKWLRSRQSSLPKVGSERLAHRGLAPVIEGQEAPRQKEVEEDFLMEVL